MLLISDEVIGEILYPSPMPSLTETLSGSFSKVHVS